MAEAYDDPDLEHYNLSDSDDHLFDTPAHKQTKSKSTMPANGKPTEQTQQSKVRPEESRYDAEEAAKERDVALRQELENVRKINEVIEGVVESLEKAKSNMDVSDALCPPGRPRMCVPLTLVPTRPSPAPSTPRPPFCTRGHASCPRRSTTSA